MMLRFIILFLYLSISAYAQPQNWDYKQAHVNNSDYQTEEIILENITPDYISVPVPKFSLKRGTIIKNNHITLKEVKVDSIPDSISKDPQEVIGMQVRKPLFKGKMIELDKIGGAILVKRNQEVDIIFKKGNLIMTTTGRALSEGGIGDFVKVINNESKKIISGKVLSNGGIDVSL